MKLFHARFLQSRLRPWGTHMQTPVSCIDPAEVLGAVILTLYTVQPIHALVIES